MVPCEQFVAKHQSPLLQDVQIMNVRAQLSWFAIYSQVKDFQKYVGQTTRSKLSFKGLSQATQMCITIIAISWFQGYDQG